MPKVSIVCPTFQRRPFLPQLRQFYEWQNYPRERIELIVLDDSAEPSAEVFAGNPSITYRHLPDRMDIGAKRNELNRMAQGDIIICFDDDDFYSPDRVRFAVNALRSSKAEFGGTFNMPYYFPHLDRFFQFNNKLTASSMFFTRDYGRAHKFIEGRGMAEEDTFRKSKNVVGLEGLSMIMIGHSANTVSKRLIAQLPQAPLDARSLFPDDYLKFLHALPDPAAAYSNKSQPGVVITSTSSPNLKVSVAPPASADKAAVKPRIPFKVCPLCKSGNMSKLRTADCSRHSLYSPVIAPAMTWMRCNDCAHVFTDGYFPPEVTAVIFEKTQDSQKPGWAFEQQRMISARMVEKVAQYAKGGSWLDVGFGNGALLFTAQEWGFTPVGIDLRPASVDAMQKFGIEASCVDITAVEGENRFSVISMADVLEHMPFPQEGLAAARRLLQPDGMLFVSMPNYDCAAWRLLDINNVNPYWGELEHYHNFSRPRLYALMKDTGFEPVHYGVSERYRVCMEVIARRVK